MITWSMRVPGFSASTFWPQVFGHLARQPPAMHALSAAV